MRKITGISVVFLCMAFLMASCGGGGGGTVSGTTITGTVSAPSGVSLGRTVERTASATGLVNKSSVTVEIYAIDDDGVKTGNTLASESTDSSGVYSITLPSGVSAASNIVAAASGTTPIRAIVTGSTVNINPMTELVVSEVAASSQALSNFTTAEIVSILSQVETDAENVDLAGATTVNAALATLNTGALATNLDSAVTNTSGSGTSYLLPTGLYKLAYSSIPATNAWLVTSVSNGTITATKGCEALTANGTISGSTISFSWVDDEDNVTISGTISSNNFSGTVTVNGSSMGTVTGTYVGSSYTRETWTVSANSDTATLCYTNDASGNSIGGTFDDTFPCETIDYCGLDAYWTQTGNTVSVNLFSEGDNCYAVLNGTVDNSTMTGSFSIYNSTSSTCGTAQSTVSFTATKE